MMKTIKRLPKWFLRLPLIQFQIKSMFGANFGSKDQKTSQRSKMKSKRGQRKVKDERPRDPKVFCHLEIMFGTCRALKSSQEQPELIQGSNTRHHGKIKWKSPDIQTTRRVACSVFLLHAVYIRHKLIRKFYTPCTLFLRKSTRRVVAIPRKLTFV